MPCKIEEDAEMNHLQWLEEPDVFQVNREKAHSDHLFFQSYEEMQEYPKGRLRQSLNGKWQFFYADCPQNRVADFYKRDFDMADADTIEVPPIFSYRGTDAANMSMLSIRGWRGGDTSPLRFPNA